MTAFTVHILDLVYGTGIISLDPVPDPDNLHPLLVKLVENRDVLASEVVETRRDEMTDYAVDWIRLPQCVN